MPYPTKTPGTEPGALSHPSAEEWMTYLYRELRPQDKAALSAHLAHCAECQARVAVWQQSMSCLPKWELPRPKDRSPAALGPSLWKWGLAALLVLGLGLGLGRATAARTDAKTVQALVQESLHSSLASDLRRQMHVEVQADWLAVASGQPKALNTEFRRRLRAVLDHYAAQTLATATAENQRLLAEFVETYQANRQADLQTVLALFDQAEQKRLADYLTLRHALETVAVVAADKFQRTDTELGQLASFAQARFVSDQPGQNLAPRNPSNSKGN